ncbi:MAG: DUF4367 domain-containing protein [Lachnospiraceae bacterium]
MKNRYDKAMKYIEVTKDMRDRILADISHLDLNKASSKTALYSKYKKYLPVAACFLVLIVGAVIVRDTFHLSETPPLQQIPDQAVPDIVTYNSADELSDAVGFEIKEVQDPPFAIESVDYISYWGELAQIEYIGSANTLLLRMAPGVEDVSGYYGEFTDVENHVINGCNFTIKGNDNQYILAVWQNDGYSYSVQMLESVSKEEILAAVQSIK